MALAIYLRFTHAISYRRLSRLMADLFGLAISEGALDAAFRRAMPCFDAEVGAILDRVPMRGVTAVCPLSVPLEGQVDQITISGKPMTGSSLRPAMVSRVMYRAR